MEKHPEAIVKRKRSLSEESFTSTWKKKHGEHKDEIINKKITIKIEKLDEENPIEVDSSDEADSQEDSTTFEEEPTTESETLEEDKILRESLGKKLTLEATKKKKKNSSTSKFRQVFKRKLNYASKKIEVVPPDLLVGHDYEGIILNSNQISELNYHNFFGLLSNSTTNHISILRVDDNLLTQIPPEIFNLVALTVLNLSFNRIESLPSEISHLKNLKRLYLQHNELSILPPSIGKMEGLEKMILTNNKIKKLPIEFVGLANLETFEASNNPIISPPLFICNKGPSYIRQYLQSKSSVETIDRFSFRNMSKSFTTDDIRTKKQTENPKRSKSRKFFGLTGNSELQVYPARESTSLTSIFKNSSLLDIRKHKLFFLIESSSVDAQGHRAYMEDRNVNLPYVTNSKLSKTDNVGYFGVYDGHGGHRAADFLIENLHKNILYHIKPKNGDISRVLRKGFVHTDKQWIAEASKYEPKMNDGSTAVVALIIDNELYIANVGDSRAVLSRNGKAVALTEDHKPNLPKEQRRIEKAGGRVVNSSPGVYRVNGNLAMSRSFGDLRLKDPVPFITAKPDVFHEVLTPEHTFFILGSDGLWDVMSNQQAVDIVQKYTSSMEAAEALVDEALNRGSGDNITALVSYFVWDLECLEKDEGNKKELGELGNSLGN